MLIKKLMEPLLKKETHEIFPWLKISFCKEKQNWESLMLMYNTTLEKSWSFDTFLKKVLQLGWFGTPTNYSSSLHNELGMEQIIDQGIFWVKIISKSLCISRITLVSKLFLQTFCEKILIFVQIMLDHCLYLSKLIVF